MPFDILIVAGAQDGVAVKLGVALKTRGRGVLHLDGHSAARLFTIRRGLGSSFVEPHCPMFVRTSAWTYSCPVKDADERFLRTEAYVTFWAAAALTSAPVINRPPPDGARAQFYWAAINAALGLQQSVGAEMHASGPEMIDSSHGDVWGENVHSQLGPVALLPVDVPLRARKVNPQVRYDIVTVVGTRAFPATRDSRVADLELHNRSIVLAQKFELHFATVTWTIDEHSATPVRVSAAPEENELKYNWENTVDALCEDLMP